MLICLFCTGAGRYREPRKYWSESDAGRHWPLVQKTQKGGRTNQIIDFL